jgi:hypothetical protein
VQVLNLINVRLLISSLSVKGRMYGPPNVCREARPGKPNAEISSIFHHRFRSNSNRTTPSPSRRVLTEKFTPQNWLNTPDGREGWASYFLKKGYLTDQPQRGRSPWITGEGVMIQYTVPFVEDYFTTVQNAALWPQAKLHTQARPLHPSSQANTNHITTSGQAQAYPATPPSTPTTPP